MKQKALIIAAHPDDEVFGCGGTMLQFKNADIEMRVVILADGCSSRPDCTSENIATRRAETQAAMEMAGITDCEIGLFDDQRLDRYPIAEVADWIRARVDDFEPTWIFTHSGADLNRDHRIVNEATLVAVRPKMFKHAGLRGIYCYEVSSSTEIGIGNFMPRLFVPIDIIEKGKLVKCYASEMTDLGPMSESHLMAMAVQRGAQSGLLVAEGFEIVRALL